MVGIPPEWKLLWNVQGSCSEFSNSVSPNPCTSATSNYLGYQTSTFIEERGMVSLSTLFG